ncbi:MAG: holo-ACP synthase [Gammaproteobacteria bacterium]|nr:MAG: holo-ACP synthase [Gammaproteobacteria bacterium]
MIIGIGSDILDTRRIARAIEKHPSRFAEKVLSAKELAQWQQLTANQSINFVAKRWAAKEAFAKACGTGIRFPVRWHNISLTRDKLGKPLLETHNELSQWLKERQVHRLHISLSDDNHYCLAVVVLESQDKSGANHQ